MNKIKVKRIAIERIEGSRSISLPKEDLFKTWTEANQFLRNHAQTAPSDGSYDKCDFVIEWEDGQTYAGRFDLQKEHMFQSFLLEKQVKGFITRLIEKYPEEKSVTTFFLDTHSISDERDDA